MVFINNTIITTYNLLLVAVFDMIQCMINLIEEKYSIAINYWKLEENKF